VGGDAHGDALYNIQNVVGSPFNDVLIGDNNGNRLTGGGGADFLVGGGGNDTFVFTRGAAHGDWVADFNGNGASAGDRIEFVGYGPGAILTQLDAWNWQVNYNGDTQHEVITFQNGILHPSDWSFV
jgi:Ca2+-binding RTX toxin-like protein